MIVRTALFLCFCLTLAGCTQMFGKWYHGRWVVDGEKTSAYNKQTDKGFGDLVGFFQSLEFRVDEDEVIEITDTEWIVSEGPDDIEAYPYTILSESDNEAKLRVDGEVRHLGKDGKWIYLQLAGNVRIYFKEAGG
ncbi:MAG: hypothetical protein R3236_01135 [Phycisphaeraceae bacterium]|nr:hypothetical protein [Phycisphaeraceae bacterium]